MRVAVRRARRSRPSAVSENGAVRRSVSQSRPSDVAGRAPACGRLGDDAAAPAASAAAATRPSRRRVLGRFVMVSSGLLAQASRRWLRSGRRRCRRPPDDPDLGHHAAVPGAAAVARGRSSCGRRAGTRPAAGAVKMTSRLSPGPTSTRVGGEVVRRCRRRPLQQAGVLGDDRQVDVVDRHGVVLVAQVGQPQQHPLAGVAGDQRRDRLVLQPARPAVTSRVAVGRERCPGSRGRSAARSWRRSRSSR